MVVTFSLTSFRYVPAGREAAEKFGSGMEESRGLVVQEAVANLDYVEHVRERTRIYVIGPSC